MSDSNTDQAKPMTRVAELELEVEDTIEEELTSIQLLILTCTLGGLQVIWSILNGNINVFLLSIGIPASISPLIWVIAPLCGTVVQPVVGWMSDQSESTYGRRKPFVFFGTLATVVTLLGLSWSQDFAEAMSTAENRTSVIASVTITWVILLNVSIQPLQMGIRALVMDGCPKAQQPQANAWAGCAASVGNVFGYLVSFATARTSIHVFGFGHFKYLALIASLCLTVTVTVNLWLSEESRPHPTQSTHSQQQLTLWSLIQHLRKSKLVTSRTRTINRVQFCAWMGWFPFLFYMTVFVGQSSSNPNQTPSTSQSKSQPGALAGFLYALISCIGSLLIPHLLQRTKYASAEIKASSASPIATLFGFSLEQVWCAGQILFGLLMFTTILASTSTTATVLVACAGVPWALANYIPFALLGVEVAERRSVVDLTGTSNGDDGDGGGGTMYAGFGAGATIGLHNAAISAPQIVAALVSAVVIAASARLGVADGVGWVMRLSGVAAWVAAWQVRRLFH